MGKENGSFAGAGRSSGGISAGASRGAGAPRGGVGLAERSGSVSTGFSSRGLASRGLASFKDGGRPSLSFGGAEKPSLSIGVSERPTLAFSGTRFESTKSASTKAPGKLYAPIVSERTASAQLNTPRQANVLESTRIATSQVGEKPTLKLGPAEKPSLALGPAEKPSLSFKGSKFESTKHVPEKAPGKMHTEKSNEKRVGVVQPKSFSLEAVKATIPAASEKVAQKSSSDIASGQQQNALAPKQEAAHVIAPVPSEGQAKPQTNESQHQPNAVNKIEVMAVVAAPTTNIAINKLPEYTPDVSVANPATTEAKAAPAGNTTPKEQTERSTNTVVQPASQKQEVPAPAPKKTDVAPTTKLTEAVAPKAQVVRAVDMHTDEPTIQNPARKETAQTKPAETIVAEIQSAVAQSTSAAPEITIEPATAPITVAAKEVANANEKVNISVADVAANVTPTAEKTEEQKDQPTEVSPYTKEVIASYVLQQKKKKDEAKQKEKTDKEEQIQRVAQAYVKAGLAANVAEGVRRTQYYLGIANLESITLEEIAEPDEEELQKIQAKELQIEQVIRVGRATDVQPDAEEKTEEATITEQKVHVVEETEVYVSSHSNMHQQAEVEAPISSPVKAPVSPVVQPVQEVVVEEQSESIKFKIDDEAQRRRLEEWETAVRRVFPAFDWEYTAPLHAVAAELRQPDKRTNSTLIYQVGKKVDGSNQSPDDWRTPLQESDEIVNVTMAGQIGAYQIMNKPAVIIKDQGDAASKRDVELVLSGDDGQAADLAA